MKLKRHIKLIKIQIAYNETYEAIKNLLDLSEGTSYHCELTNISATFHYYKKQDRIGAVRKDELIAGLSKINESLLDIIKILEDRVDLHSRLMNNISNDAIKQKKSIHILRRSLEPLVFAASFLLLITFSFHFQPSINVDLELAKHCRISNSDFLESQF